MITDAKKQMPLGTPRTINGKVDLISEQTLNQLLSLAESAIPCCRPLLHVLDPSENARSSVTADSGVPMGAISGDAAHTFGGGGDDFIQRLENLQSRLSSQNGELVYFRIVISFNLLFTCIQGSHSLSRCLQVSRFRNGQNQASECLFSVNAAGYLQK